MEWGQDPFPHLTSEAMLTSSQRATAPLSCIFQLSAVARSPFQSRLIVSLAPRFICAAVTLRQPRGAVATLTSLRRWHGHASEARV